jgi:hypothetical protein
LRDLARLGNVAPMPSPVGHALGGLAAGWLIAGAPASLPSFRSFSFSSSRSSSPSNSSSRSNSSSSSSSTPDRRASRVSISATPWIATWRGAILFASLGMAADLDLLVGLHRMYSHSLAAALCVMVAAMVLTPASEARVLTGVACGAAYASHILLDWLGNDTSPPIGIMALWPISTDYYQSPLQWFLSTTRRYSLPHFWTQNLMAAAREVGTLLPIAAAIYVLRRRRQQ